MKRLLAVIISVIVVMCPVLVQGAEIDGWTMLEGGKYDDTTYIQSAEITDKGVKFTGKGGFATGPSGNGTAVGGIYNTPVDVTDVSFEITFDNPAYHASAETPDTWIAFSLNNKPKLFNFAAKGDPESLVVLMRVTSDKEVMFQPHEWSKSMGFIGLGGATIEIEPKKPVKVAIKKADEGLALYVNDQLVEGADLSAFPLEMFENNKAYLAFSGHEPAQVDKEFSYTVNKINGEKPVKASKPAADTKKDTASAKDNSAAAEADQATAEQPSSNPKTGDVSVLVYAMMGVAAIGGLAVGKRKK